MPLYEYRCGACSGEFEAMSSIKDPPLSECPHCGKREVKRLISGSSFVLKGEGWFADGYSKKGGNDGKGE